MTATLEAPVQLRSELVLIHEDGKEELHSSTYGAAKDARARGRKAVKDLDAIDFRVQDEGTFEAASQPAVEAPEPTEFGEPAPYVPEDLGYDEMTGTDYPETEPAPKVDLAKPKRGRKAAAPKPKAVASRKERLFLEAPYITYDLEGTDVEVRVITATRADTSVALLQPTDSVSIFGHRRGLIATRLLSEVPAAMAAFVTAGKMAPAEEDEGA